VVSERHKGTPPRESFAAVPLRAGELDRLLALRAATSELTPLYAALLAVFSEAKSAYHLQLRTSEVIARLGGAGEPEADGWLSVDHGVRPALDQLREWGCLNWVQDPSFRAMSIEEYLRRHELWELTPIGETTFGAMRSVLDATEQGGSLQRALFRQISDALDSLELAVPVSDATTVYLRLRDLDLAITDLANSARDFYATVNRMAREDRLDDHVFLAYKDHLIAYLQEFHEDLARHRLVIGDRMDALDRRVRIDLLELAAEGDDSAGLFGDRADWERRWDGMRGWFSPVGGMRPEAEALSEATTVAIRELLTLLRRLTEQASRPITRADELRSVAMWFARCESDDEAHELFDAAFGLTAPVHLAMALDDVDASGRFPSWWEAVPVPVPLSLREHGRRPAPGSTPRRRDYRDAKRVLQEQIEREESLRADSTRRLITVDLSSEPVGVDDFTVLLAMLDQVLAARPAVHRFDTTVRTGGVVVRLRSADYNTRIITQAGTLTLPDCRLQITEPPVGVAHPVPVRTPTPGPSA
jgi:uncharacterized protein (TIGR02677 family)